MPPANFHESYARAGSRPTSSANRTFGLVMAVAWAALALWPLRYGAHVRAPFLAVAAGFLLAAALVPNQLAPLNAFWTRLALLLGRVTNPMIMAIVFYGLITPAGFIARGAGWLSLIRKPEPDRPSYWLARVPPGPEADSFTRQF
ncbi:MAG: hypothetical protein IT168_16200 [Bryobacterales bacterium]|nr:hypothetical protein [Bryobacterales bacterium]